MGSGQTNRLTGEWLVQVKAGEVAASNFSRLSCSDEVKRGGCRWLVPAIMARVRVDMTTGIKLWGQARSPHQTKEMQELRPPAQRPIGQLLPTPVLAASCQSAGPSHDDDVVRQMREAATRRSLHMRVLLRAVRNKPSAFTFLCAVAERSHTLTNTFVSRTNIPLRPGLAPGEVQFKRGRVELYAGVTLV